MRPLPLHRMMNNNMFLDPVKKIDLLKLFDLMSDHRILKHTRVCLRFCRNNRLLGVGLQSSSYRGGGVTDAIAVIVVTIARIDSAAIRLAWELCFAPMNVRHRLFETYNVPIPMVLDKANTIKRLRNELVIL